jgi:hypothetical protein
MARMLSMDEATIGRLENGKTQPTGRIIALLKLFLARSPGGS